MHTDYFNTDLQIENPKIMEDFSLDSVLDAHRRRQKRLKTTTPAPKMICGSFYIPKENPNKPLGEDSHFVCEAEQAIGVADGVGGWAKWGIDAGVYARHLMRNSAAAVRLKNTHGTEIDPISVLRVAYATTSAPGSSTACIASLHNDKLRVANVGDSGFWIFRDNRCEFESPIQQSRFNCPYQLGNSIGCDSPSAATEIECTMEPGDIVVLGTDGLLDNVYPLEIEALLDFMEEEEIELEADNLAQRIAETALDNSKDNGFYSPFQYNAELAGADGFTGGKIDDITVVVALIY